MNILMIYPKYPDTYWGFKHALKFINIKAVNPPLGLITVAAMLPKAWNKKLIDMNIEPLKEKEIRKADYIFISAMNVQSKSVKEVIQKCKAYNKIIVAGGPLFTEEFESYEQIDHFVLNEAELTLPSFLDDLEKGNPKRVYQSSVYADLADTPLPDYSLVKTTKYNTLNIQYTRGCPFNCEFCDITALLGHRVRAKSTVQIIDELENIYNTGWRKDIFFVDDNFIGNKKVLKNELLPAVIKWMKNKNHPFSFTTEASINLADDEDLMSLMIKAGFSTVFVGIETPEIDSLSECGKIQNKNRDLIQSVKKIQEAGIVVTGGFIVGFDNDTKHVFQNQIDFIQESGIISAMVGLLNAPKKTRLYKRLKEEGRIFKEISGNNTDYSINFIPKMKLNDLLNGYKKVIAGIYKAKPYYKRVLSFVKRFEPKISHKDKITFFHIIAFIRSIFVLGIIDKERKYFWNLLLWSIKNKPKSVPQVLTYSIYGYHFRKVFKEVI